MAIVTRGRVLRGATGTTIKGEQATERESVARVVTREVIDAHVQAKEILARAEKRAEGVMAKARADATHAVSRAVADAREEEVAKLSAGFLALRRREDARAEGDLDRAIQLATVLAERLLGAALEARPERIVDLARSALADARGARKVVIEAHPLDADALRSNLEAVGLPKDAVEIRSNSEHSRGSLSLQTDLGNLDARLRPQLERLASALRIALHRP